MDGRNLSGKIIDLLSYFKNKSETALANYQSAEHLYQILKTFGVNLYKMSYSSQTAQMKKLIEELDKPENITKITALSLTATFTDMKTKQTAFETLFAEQATANADLRNMKSASGIQKDLEKSLKSFLYLITAMKDVKIRDNLKNMKSC